MAAAPKSKQRCENMRSLYCKYNTPQHCGLLCPQRCFCDMETIKAHANLFEVAVATG
jgi:hypothetical protein